MSGGGNPYLLTLPQLMSAKKKIGHVSAFFDPQKTSLRGFESTVLNPTQFREQLRRNLSINVTDAELGALVTLFDKTGDGLVDSIEFKNEFFRLGKQERAKFVFEKSEESRRIAEWKERQRQAKAKKFELFSYASVATSWSKEQENSAIRKLANVAFHYDPLKGGLRGFFNCTTMTAAEFKDQMRRNFEVYFSPEETGALLSMFDRDGSGVVDCKEFVYQFFRIGRNEKDSHFTRNMLLTHEKQQLHKERLEEISERYSQRVQAKMTPAREKDKYSAFEKIRHAAMCYKGDSAFSGNLSKIFESEALTPTAFKQLLKSNFEILLSPGELDAVVKMFDVQGDGLVSCVEFITTFFRISLHERSVQAQARREQTARANLEAEEALRQKAAGSLASVVTRIVWPVLPNEDGDFSAPATSPQAGPVAAVTDAKEILRHRPRASMQDILSPVKGAAGKSSGPLAALFPKASQDTKDFLMSLELQEREIKLMSSQARRERSVAEEAEAEAREKKAVRGGKKGAKKGGKRGKRRALEHDQQQEEEEGYVGVEEEIEEEGVSLMDKSWAFADGCPAGASLLDYGSRPGTSAGGHGGSRGGGGDGLSRGHTSSSRIVPIDEEFGDGGPCSLEIPVTEVDDDDC